MKITIFQGAFFPVPPVMGGAVEKLWFTMGSEFARCGHEVVHISKKHESLPNQEMLNGVRHVRVKGYNSTKHMTVNLLLDFFYSLRTVLRCPKSDIVITNTFWSPVLLGIFKKGAIYVSAERFPKKQMCLYKHAKRIRTPTTAVKDAIILQTPLVTSKIVVIPNFLPSKYTGQVQHIDKIREMKLLYVGRVHPEKGIHLLIKAAVALDITLEIIGSHEISKGGGGDIYFAQLQEIATDKIHFLGPIYDDVQLIEHYKNAFAFVYPSLAENGESFGLAPLEAMACGTIPIVSSLSCFRDFIEEGVHGFYFDHSKDFTALKNAIQSLLSLDSIRLADMRGACVLQADKYSAPAVSKYFIEDFEAIIHEPK